MKTKVSLKDMPSHETVLVYGKPKIGKTWAYCSAIDKCVSAGKNVFLINTDNGVKRSLQEYFGERFDEAVEHIHYYLVSNIDDVNEVIEDIRKTVTSDDLIVIDLVSDFWEFAQTKFIENLSGGNITDYIERASRDKQKFGTLSGQQWSYVKALDSHVLNGLVVRPLCKIIAVASAKQIEFDKIHGNKEVVDRYSVVGEKPGGQRNLQYLFNTIVYIGEDKNKYFVVLGDRGKFSDGQRVLFGRDFWTAFTKYRDNK